jgi:hypothetical protein
MSEMWPQKNSHASSAALSTVLRTTMVSYLVNLILSVLLLYIVFSLVSPIGRNTLLCSNRYRSSLNDLFLIVEKAIKLNIAHRL